MLVLWNIEKLLKSLPLIYCYLHLNGKSFASFNFNQLTD